MSIGARSIMTADEPSGLSMSRRARVWFKSSRTRLRLRLMQVRKPMSARRANTVRSGDYGRQGPDSLSSGNTKLLILFVGIVAFSMLVQAIAVIVLAIGAVKARKRALEIAEEVRAKVMPILDTTQSVLHDSAPK